MPLSCLASAEHVLEPAPATAAAEAAPAAEAAAATAAAALLTGGLTAAVADPAADVWTHELLVDSLGQTPDATPGDGVCADAAGECTLRAAIEESNALDGGAGEVRIGVHPEFAGGRIPLSAATTTWMRTTPVYTVGVTSIPGDVGAVFEVTAPVTIDLEHKITAAPDGNLDLPAATVFHLDGADITVMRADQVYGGESSFYIGPDASRVTLTDGTVTPPNFWPERFVVVRGGASDVRISDYTLSGYASSPTEWGWGFVDGAGAANPVRGLTVTNMTYSTQTTGVCDGVNSGGCASSPMSLRNQHVTDFTFRDNTITNWARSMSHGTRMMDLRGATVGTFVFSGNTITGPRQWGAEPLLDLGPDLATAAQVTDLEIVGNVFTGVMTDHFPELGMIRLPYNLAIAGSARIADNVFHAERGWTSAVYWWGPNATDDVSVAPSGLVIEDNAFDGWGTAGSVSSVRMRRTGAVTVQGNTFGAGSGAQTNTVREEATTIDNPEQTLVNNAWLGANGKLNGWFPTARNAQNVQASPVEAWLCTVDIEVAPPTDPESGTALPTARFPGSPVTLDVYWTASHHAEVLLESVTLDSAERQTLAVQLPRAGDERLAHFPAGAVLPVDPATNEVRGGIRVQTHDPTVGATTASSQLSRVAAIGGTCGLELVIDQAAEQNDPTLARDLHYTVQSSLPLDPASLTPEAVTLTAEATEDTLDASRLNPRVVSAEPVAGSDDMEFTVVARVDDSALVRAEIPADAVRTVDGETNEAPATSTDAEITFVNPLVVAPSPLVIITGEGQGAEYSIGTRGGAPVPQTDLTFTTAVDETGSGLGVTVDPAEPVLAAGATETDGIRVGAPEQAVEAGTAVRVAHEVASDDTNYDGLVVADLDVRLYSASPFVQITKRAYVDVTDSTTPESVLVTGTEALAGSRLSEGQPVCWVYTVVNTSADDWVTSLTDVVVRDSDTRLGNSGLIGTVPELGVGQSTRLHACAVLIPTDTRAVG